MDVDVEIAEERIVVLTDRFNLDHEEGRAWAKRVDAFGTVARLGGLLNRPDRTTTSASTASGGFSPSGGYIATLSRPTSGRATTWCRWRRVHSVQIAGRDQNGGAAAVPVSGLEGVPGRGKRRFLFRRPDTEQEPRLGCVP
jgi:hypothetical protein